MEIQGKRAIVLGGTSGIGLAATRQLEAAGASVLACSRSDSNLASARAATGDAVSFRAIDVRTATR